MSISPFIRAHGYVPGPTERPVAAGLLSGVLACGPALLIAAAGGGLSEVAQRTGLAVWGVAACSAAFLMAAGALYGRVFMRAANDRRGGWLFGIAYGFLLWLIGPVTLAHWLDVGPLAVGVAAQAIFAAHVAFGLGLGLAFPRGHRLVQQRRRNEKAGRP